MARAFLETQTQVAEVRLSRVRGSSPREEGATIYVTPDAVNGTIGGGQLEYMAIDEARAMLARGADDTTMDVPLGPEIGQCCGGRVELTLTRMTEADRRAAIAAEEAASLPQVLIFGAGHVGRALASALALLPLKCRLIDSRAEELALNTAPVETCLTPLPEAEVAKAPAGAAYVILTHDHSLDFLIAAEVLKRSDTAYAGMIGSKTKRAQFASFCRREGIAPEGLTCPIGAPGCHDKRPQVIAALAAAEIIAAITNFDAEAPGPVPEIAVSKGI